MDKMRVDIYTESIHKGNPIGQGNAIAVIKYTDKTGKTHTRQSNVSIESGTKNELDLKICISAIKLLIKQCQITIYTDNSYIVNTYERVRQWKSAGWKKANGKPPANIEDWKQFCILMDLHNIQIKETT